MGKFNTFANLVHVYTLTAQDAVKVWSKGPWRRFMRLNLDSLGAASLKKNLELGKQQRASLEPNLPLLPRRAKEQAGPSATPSTPGP